ncbi:hypothetical protein JQR85_17965 [Stutzerimonas urumqiensis]|uniref:hypothetical protein n=1 Tax=Stutzerimonas urumqiensis TaxID=638269 RepID=UPI003DA40726
MNRRRFFVASAATLGVAAIGTAAFVYQDRYSFIAEAVRRLMGHDYRVAAAQQKAFVDDFLEEYSDKRTAGLIAFQRGHELGLGSSFSAYQIDRFERELITHVVTHTDYLAKAAGDSHELSYLGRYPCRNPFAQFTV